MSKIASLTVLFAKFAKFTRGSYQLNYATRLKSFNPEFLEHRGFNFDLTTCFKAVFGFTDTRCTNYFSLLLSDLDVHVSFSSPKDVAAQTMICIVSTSMLYESGICFPPTS